MRTPRPVGRRTTLPAPVEPLIGRDAEAIALRDLLTDQDVRLVTLTGPGGIGKTRLAQHVAAELGDHFPHGVFFVPLAALAVADLLAAATRIKLLVTSRAVLRLRGRARCRALRPGAPRCGSSDPR